MSHESMPAALRLSDQLGPLPDADWTPGATLNYSAEQMRAYALQARDAERNTWRAIAHRVAADANRYGCEGLRMRCKISDTGALVSWEVDRA